MSPPLYSTLGQTPGTLHLLLIVTKVTSVLKTRRHGPSDARTKLSNHSSISQKILVSFTRGTRIIYLPSLRVG